MEQEVGDNDVIENKRGWGSWTGFGVQESKREEENRKK